MMSIINKTAALLAFAGAMLLQGCDVAQRQNEPEKPSFYAQVKSVDKLILAQMTISKMATIDDIDLSKAKGMKQTAVGLLDAVKLGNRKAAYSYDTYLRAFIDLSGLAPDDVVVNDADHTVTVTLPPVKTEFTGCDMEIREDHYRVSGMRSHIDARERAAIKDQMKESLKHEVEEKPEFRDKLSAQARAKAQAYFKSLLDGNGYEVIVKFN